MKTDTLTTILLEGVRDLMGAKEAWLDKDEAKSRECHMISVRDLDAHHSELHSSTVGELLRATVFGGLDGIVTIFALLSSCVGAGISIKQIMLIGVGNLLADAFAMGFGEYISSKAQDDFTRTEAEREEWEIKHYPEGEKREMVTLYTKKYNFSDTDAEIYVDIGMRYPQYFLQHMLTEELGLQLPESTTSGPTLRGLAMFTSFVIHGLIPLGGFVCMLYYSNAQNVEFAFGVTCILTIITLYSLGTVKAWICAQPVWINALSMTFNGIIASTAAFFAAKLLKSF